MMAPGALTVWAVEVLCEIPPADPGGHLLLRGTESVPLGFHDSVQKRLPELVRSDALVQAVAFKTALPTLTTGIQHFQGRTPSLSVGQLVPSISFFIRQLFSASLSVMGLYLAFEH